MGEIFHALEVLNRSMKLGLSGQNLLRAEMGFKSALAMHGNPAEAQLAGDPVRLAERYELKATLHPRATALSLAQLSKFAGQAVRQPPTRVDAATFKQIDKAIAAMPTKAPTRATKAGAKKTGAAKGSASKKARKTR